MDFVSYAERAATIVNARIDDEADLRELLTARPWLAERVTPDEPAAVRRLQDSLRPVFGAPQTEVVARLNALLREHPVSPFISGHDAQDWHLHVADSESSVTETLAAEVLMGMAVLACDLGADRFGTCAAAGCDGVFVDTSPNRSRRYCSDRCSSRANVAAYRARRRKAAAGA